MFASYIFVFDVPSTNNPKLAAEIVKALKFPATLKTANGEFEVYVDMSKPTLIKEKAE